MHDALVPRRFVVFAAIILTIIVFFSSSNDISPREFVWGVYNHGWNPNSKPDVFNSLPVDSQAIRNICSASNWNSSLIFTCDNNRGGVANVRNSILNCVRLTIAAGGSLVLPQIYLRELNDGMGSNTDINRRGLLKQQGMDYMFDLNHFSSSLRQSCPELLLIRHLDQKPDQRRHWLQPENLFPNIPTSGFEHPEEWPRRLNDWLEINIPPPSTPDAKEPIVIDLGQSFLHYPTHSDGHAVAHIFGNILKFRADIRELATKALNTLVEWYELPVNISHAGILKPSFLGVHLNTNDPLLEERHRPDIQYSHYETQSQAYLKLSYDMNLPIIYVASGNIDDVQKFNDKAIGPSIAVTYKEHLLEEKDHQQLQRLTYDQRAMVDYLVLSKAEAFAGVGHSPFSWNVAMTREQLGAVMEGQLADDIWKDGMNTLFGVRPDYVESSACMWP
ncbi:BgTH12-05957 [Blumeria graminis f. sp. triticale]|uniref:Bgt-3463 n=3 Tax=Blumeria graminis TaxID=34373 RepID=A0A381LJP1_BLUGR|nr:hypothetical protein BGT96224_3463 [Blumeria graminis f. sp. tritici 96224]CAD6504223.1 BgTH12-05957 [Blumeria graminis f. sp. triticale]VDB91038.1 Bgt-3463 [Blumeria graminis f. sp. tritici]